MRTHLTTALASLLAATGCATSDPREHVAADLEIPRYDVLARDGEFELRAYSPTIVARTEVEGDRDRASNEGFRRLAGYIFGKNRARAEIAMTAPVSAREAGASAKIAMTAPVSATPSSGKWEITFTMPGSYALEDLPVPLDGRVSLVERPTSCVAAVVFDGLTTERSVASKTSALEAWMAAQGYPPKSAATVARYNTPWTLPSLRRNEVLIEVECAPR